MSAEIPELEIWPDERFDEEYIGKLFDINGLDTSIRDEEILEWALSVFEKDDFLAFYDTAEIILMRRIEKEELRHVDTILRSPNLTSQERLDELVKMRWW